MDKAGNPSAINDHLRRHAAQLEQVDFLTVQLENAGGGIWQANKRQFMLLPIFTEGSGVFRSNHDDLSVPAGKFFKVTAQLRHMPLAEWSGKAAVENQQNIVFAEEVGEGDRFPAKVGKRKIRGGRIQSNNGHSDGPFRSPANELSSR